MRKLPCALLILVAAAGLASRLASEEAPEKAGEAVAHRWLALVDAGHYGESWDAAAAMFKQALTREKWMESLQKVRAPLGKVASRKPKSAQYTRQLPGAPAGEYVVIQYETSFANRPGSTETVTPMKDKDGVWRVSGYYVK
jgi:hypothetical protein